MKKLASIKNFNNKIKQKPKKRIRCASAFQIKILSLLIKKI